MHFCKVCNNMYYIRMKSKQMNSLIYYCRQCGNEDDSFKQNLNNICVSKTYLKTQGIDNYHHLINEYTKLDPTLPIIDNISCPNEVCPSNNETSIDETKTTNNKEKAKNKIIYLRVDDETMKFLYICTNCDKIWNTNNND